MFILLPLEAFDAQLKLGCHYLGIEIRRMHAIRKTYASNLHQAGVPISDISRVLGHEDESTTIKHYIYSPIKQTEADEMILEALGNSSDKKVTEGNQKIIQFSTTKKQESLVK